MGGKIINVSYIQEVCAGDKDLITEMINIFKDQVVEFSTEFNSLYKNEEYFNLGLMAHKAKSSVAIMGMEELASDLKELEIKAKEGTDIEKYKGFINKFEEQTKIAIRELDDYLNTL